MESEEDLVGPRHGGYHEVGPVRRWCTV